MKTKEKQMNDFTRDAWRRLARYMRDVSWEIGLLTGDDRSNLAPAQRRRLAGGLARIASARPEGGAE